jgi:hypothetical protein
MKNTTRNNEHKSLLHHVAKLGLGVVGLIISAVTLVCVLGCQSVPQNLQPKNSVVINVNSIVGGDSSYAPSGTVTMGSCNYTNTQHLQIMVSFRDPVSSSSTSSLTAEPATTVSIPASIIPGVK